MQTRTSAFLTRQTVIQGSVVQDAPVLRLLDTPHGYGGLDLFLGDALDAFPRYVIVAQLRALRDAIAELSRPYAMDLAALDQIDEPDDDPTDDPVAIVDGQPSSEGGALYRV